MDDHDSSRSPNSLATVIGVPADRLTVVHWYDFICPFCYIAQARNRLLAKRGFALTDLAFEIHPEIPPRGRYVGPRSGKMYAKLQIEADKAGLPLHWPERLPNSRTALGAAEWVRRNQPDMFGNFAQSLFAAHFADRADIGSQDDVTTYGLTARRLAVGANALVLAVNYHKAPEYPFPTAHDDAWAAYGWTRDNIESLGGDRNRIAVVGESAGGSLAATVTIRAVAEGAGPAAQILVRPLADSDMESPAYRRMPGVDPWAARPWSGFSSTLSRIPLPETIPASSLYAQRSGGSAVHHDPHRRSGPVAQRRPATCRPLTRGRSCRRRQNVAGVGHEFFCMNKLVPAAGFALDTVIANLKQAFGGKAKY